MEYKKRKLTDSLKGELLKFKSATVIFIPAYYEI